MNISVSKISTGFVGDYCFTHARAASHPAAAPTTSATTAIRIVPIRVLILFTPFNLFLFEFSLNQY